VSSLATQLVPDAEQLLSDSAVSGDSDDDRSAGFPRAQPAPTPTPETQRARQSLPRARTTLAVRWSDLSPLDATPPLRSSVSLTVPLAALAAAYSDPLPSRASAPLSARARRSIADAPVTPRAASRADTGSRLTLQSAPSPDRAMPAPPAWTTPDAALLRVSSRFTRSLRAPHAENTESRLAATADTPRRADLTPRASAPMLPTRQTQPPQPSHARRVASTPGPLMVTPRYHSSS
jgi:hypothetical protein